MNNKNNNMLDTIKSTFSKYFVSKTKARLLALEERVEKLEEINKRKRRFNNNKHRHQHEV